MLAVFWIGNGKGPVVSVVAQGADQLLLGHYLHHPTEVADKPLLAGDRAGVAVDFVLVVVHEQNAIGVGGDKLQVIIPCGERNVDIKPKIARVHIGVEFPDEAQVCLIRVVGQVFDVQREAGIDPLAFGPFECGEKADDLLAQRSALVRVD